MSSGIIVETQKNTLNIDEHKQSLTITDASHSQHTLTVTSNDPNINTIIVDIGNIAASVEKQTIATTLLTQDTPQLIVSTGAGNIWDQLFLLTTLNNSIGLPQFTDSVSSELNTLQYLIDRIEALPIPPAKLMDEVMLASVDGQVISNNLIAYTDTQIDNLDTQFQSIDQRIQTNTDNIGLANSRIDGTIQTIDNHTGLINTNTQVLTATTYTSTISSQRLDALDLPDGKIDILQSQISQNAGNIDLNIHSIETVDGKTVTNDTNIGLTNGRIDLTVQSINEHTGLIDTNTTLITSTSKTTTIHETRLNALDQPGGSIEDLQSQIYQSADRIDLNVQSIVTVDNKTIKNTSDLSLTNTNITSYVEQLNQNTGDINSATIELTATTASTNISNKRLNALELMTADRWGVNITEDINGVSYITGVNLILHPTWITAYSYKVGDYVSWINNNISHIYKCLVDNTSNNDNCPTGSSGNTYWVEDDAGQKSEFRVKADLFSIYTSVGDPSVPLLTLDNTQLLLSDKVALRSSNYQTTGEPWYNIDPATGIAEFNNMSMSFTTAGLTQAQLALNVSDAADNTANIIATGELTKPDGKLVISNNGSIEIDTNIAGKGLIVGDYDNGNGWGMNANGLYSYTLVTPLHGFSSTNGNNWQQFSNISGIEPINTGFMLDDGDIVLGGYNYKYSDGSGNLGGIFWDQSAAQLKVRGAVVEESTIGYDQLIGAPPDDADNTATVVSTDSITKTNGDLIIDSNGSIQIHTGIVGKGLIVGDYGNGNGWGMNANGLYSYTLNTPLHGFSSTNGNNWQQFSNITEIEPINTSFILDDGDVVLGGYNYQYVSDGTELGGIFWDQSEKIFNIRGKLVSGTIAQQIKVPVVATPATHAFSSNTQGILIGGTGSDTGTVINRSGQWSYFNKYPLHATCNDTGPFAWQQYEDDGSFVQVIDSAFTVDLGDMVIGGYNYKNGTGETNPGQEWGGLFWNQSEKKLAVRGELSKGSTINLGDGNTTTIVNSTGALIAENVQIRGKLFAIDSEFYTCEIKGTLTINTDGKIIAGNDAIFDINGIHNTAGTYSLTENGIIATAGKIADWNISSESLSSTDVGIISGANAKILLGHNSDYTLAKIGLRHDGSGKLASNTISWDAAGLVLFKNTINALGEIDVGDTSSNYLIIDGSPIAIKTSNFQTGINGSGMSITPEIAEFQNIRARGTIRTAVFQKDSIVTVGGNLFVTPADTLSTDMTGLDSSHIIIDGNETFAVNDVLRIKEGSNDEWFIVTGVNGNDYTVNRDQAAQYSSNVNPEWKKGATVLNYGQAGNGIVFSQSGNIPYTGIFTHNGSPWLSSGLSHHMRFGNLNGYMGNTGDVYGIHIGNLTNYLQYDPNNGLVNTGISKGGQTAYNTGNGYWMGQDTDSNWKFSFKTDTKHYVNMDNTGITLSGSINDLTPWVDKNTNFTAVSNTKYNIDTTNNIVEMTLPLTPDANDTVFWADAKSMFGTNNFIIRRNGENIMGQAEDMTCPNNDESYALIYTGATYGWRLL